MTGDSFDDCRWFGALTGLAQFELGLSASPSDAAAGPSRIDDTPPGEEIGGDAFAGGAVWCGDSCGDPGGPPAPAEAVWW
mmetsp:Transcript_5846/g.7220  ORF Transcript_5846/g.7220 Transcript_5846/m.7220 type:complete len:80 (+) Transcript_5846:453-692(+)|eukprot:CAMPEP_0185780856 /NCGR_PEP_ID=MMETSP1174-20130828/100383_1 /TAXON_ID=35687 /ORGANISM="Dictyocha speculum, Strain CCMP1381" /LENGTH=79 /DNA_ID=CAMNT_0028470575 /DNA_START=452 /DNA_END=691 /DNA_ORIENTATION=-